MQYKYYCFHEKKNSIHEKWLIIAYHVGFKRKGEMKENPSFKAINFPGARTMISSVSMTQTREGAPSCSHPVDVAAAQ